MPTVSLRVHGRVEAYRGRVSVPLEQGREHRQITVKIVDD